MERKESIRLRNSRKCMYCIPIWLVGFGIAGIIGGVSFWLLGVGANRTTLHYVNSGYDPATIEWNPREPLDDLLLPSPEWLEERTDWLLSKPVLDKDYTEWRDLPFTILLIMGMGLPFLFGRMDIFIHIMLVQACLMVFKMFIAFTWQTPPAQGQRLAIHELGGMENVYEWREAANSDGWPYYKKLCGVTMQHAADMVYSGHTFNGIIPLTAGMRVLNAAKIPGSRCIFWSYTIISTLIFLLGMFIMMVTRGHYSFDVVLAYVLWFL